MGRYIVRRLLQVIPVFFGATLLIFFMVFAIPGDPVRGLGGDRPLPPAQQAAIRDEYNLDDPFMIQYGKYIAGLPQGDFGKTIRGEREVTEIMAERFPVTLKLAAGAFLFEALLGLMAGILAGLRRGSFLDNLVLLSTTFVVAIPIFVLGFLAQYVIGVKFQSVFNLPIAGVQEGLKSYILPSIVLGSASLAYIARLLRTSLVENLGSDYVRTATAKGLSRARVVGRHTLRNSLIPVVTFLGVDLGALMGGAIITEGIFNIPGIGGAVFEATRRQENTVVVGIVMFLVIVYMLANLIVDIMYAYLDPRIRYE